MSLLPLSAVSLTPSNPPPDHIIDAPYPFSRALNFEPLSMLLPARRTQLLYPFLGEFQMDESLYTVAMRNFADLWWG